jgi:hypothetical protein
MRSRSRAACNAVPGEGFRPIRPRRPPPPGSAQPEEPVGLQGNRVLAPHAAEALTHPPPFGLSAPNPTLNPGS